MHGKMTSYLLVAGASIVVGLAIAGTPVRSLLPLVLLLACPLMMILMMGGMHGGGTHGGGTQGQSMEHRPEDEHRHSRVQ
jgi:hypothetical protein